MAYEKAFEPTSPGTVERKTIPQSVVAEAETQASYFDHDNNLFRRLFRFINENDISMTVPVEADVNPGRMRFFIAPSQVDRAESTASVEVMTREPIDVVSAGLRGGYSESRFEKGVDRLRQWLKEHPEWIPTGDPVAVYWNGPFTLPFLKKSEVYIPIRRQREE